MDALDEKLLLRKHCYFLNHFFSLFMHSIQVPRKLHVKWQMQYTYIPSDLWTFLQLNTLYSYFPNIPLPKTDLKNV